MDTKRAFPKASPASEWRPRGVLVFVDDASRVVVDTAAELALERGGPLHLVAASGRRGRARLRDEAARAWRFRIAVVPHVTRGRTDDVVASVTEAWGPVTLVTDSSVHLAKAV